MLARDEYERRLHSRQARVRHYDRLHMRVGYLRLAVVTSAAAVAWAAWARGALSAWWLAVPAAAFVASGIALSRIMQAKTFAERAAAVYRAGLARLGDRWAGTGQTGERFNDPHHPYAADLDLFGRGSLFELLSQARTRMGEDTLARWLLAPSPVAEVRARHAAVRELRDRLDVREDIAVLGEDAGVGVHPDDLLAWAEAPPRLSGRAGPRIALLLALCATSGAVVWGVWDTATPFFVVVIAEGVLAWRFRKRIAAGIEGVERAFANLDLLSAVLARIEREPVQAARLAALQEHLRAHHTRASEAIGKLRTLMTLIESRDNVLFKLLDIPLLFSLQVAYAAERWRSHHGMAVRGWIAAVGEFEALLSLAAYRYEHPEDALPEFVESAACFAADALGHPLIAAAACVRNDFTLGDDTRVLLVSGSNMSGKSTLLRAVGINAVLAMAGAPVRASRLRITPLRVGASIRINDSLQEGSSRFYAEITRVRALLDLAGPPTDAKSGLEWGTGDNVPLLFLLDELLQGTNSHDRRIGAEGIVRALAQRGAIGLVSTHDLALTEIAGVANVHFEDKLEQGRISFDYKLRAGVLQKSNGLELMRSVGIEV